jgi:two-component system chemotaxis response regulator CheY
MATQVLIVDDAGFIREILRSLCDQAGLVVVGEAVDGIEAVQLGMKLKPDLIFMDLVLPQKNGIQATKEILEAHPEIRIIACTTLADEALLIEAKQAGCSGVLQKPFRKLDFQNILKTAFYGQEVKHA